MKKLLSIPMVAITLTILLGGSVTLGAIYIGGSGRVGEVNLQKGLVGHWNLNGNANDSTPNRNHGSITGATLSADRKSQSNKAYSLNGTTDYLRVDSSALRLVHNSGEVSYVVWFEYTAGNDGAVVHRGSSSSGGGFTGCQYEPRINTTSIHLSGCSGSGLVGNFTPVEGWNHLAVTFSESGDTAKIYLNGALEVNKSIAEVKTASTSSSLIFNAQSVASSIMFGGTIAAGVLSGSFPGDLDDMRIYNRALSADEVTALYDAYDPGTKVSETQKGLVGHWKFDGNAMDATPYSNHGTVSGASLTLDHTSQANKAYSFNTSLESLLMNYRLWKDGQTGSIGSFSANGSASENYRILGEDPWGREIVIWEARPDATSGADGGWGHTIGSASIDNTQLYRFSVWVNRTVQGNGSFYLGTNGYGSTDGVYYRDNGSNSTNPYFWVSSTPTVVGTWTLVVGHVWPAGSGTGSNHADSGRYTISGGKIGNITRDFVWRAETTSSRHRSYLYYSTNTDTRQRWAYPRVDLVDGTEPSIQDLLDGFDIVGDDVEADVSEDKTSFSFRYNQSGEGVWTHVANSSGTLYVNGELGTPTYYPVVVNGNKVYIGRTTMSDFFNGSIDDVRIYNRALTLSEVEELSDSHNPVMQVSDLQKGLLGYWNLNENARDSTPYRNHGTVTGAALTTDRKGQTNMAYSFNGTGDWILGSNSLGVSGDASLTMSCWIYWNDAAWNTSNYPSAIGNNSTGTTNRGLSMTFRNGQPAIDFWSNRFRATSPLNVQTWYHVAVTKSPGVISTTSKIYVNGDLVAGAVEGTDTTPDILDSAPVIGRLDATRWFKGSIDDCRVYNRTLSPTEITTLYESYQ